jgi:hypothetical protein
MRAGRATVRSPTRIDVGGGPVRGARRGRTAARGPAGSEDRAGGDEAQITWNGARFTKRPSPFFPT